MIFAGKIAGEIVWHSVGRLSAGKLAGSDMGEVSADTPPIARRERVRRGGVYGR
jgi:hypothetical protein